VRLLTLVVCGCWVATVVAGAALAQGRTAPAFTSAGELILPTDYREWIFVGTGLGMTYGPTKRTSEQSLVFDNIYVAREAYGSFLQSGTWPEGTMFVMEGRASESHQLLANAGQTQGDARFLEASVKDSTRFPDTTWGYFNFGAFPNPRSTARPLAKTSSCYTCHAENTAVENSFVQYYPALFAAAKKHGTVKPTYDPTKRF
jgi:hypothetical protein